MQPTPNPTTSNPATPNTSASALQANATAPSDKYKKAVQIKLYAFWVNIAAMVLSVVSLFIPYVSFDDTTYSLITLAKQFKEQDEAIQQVTKSSTGGITYWSTMLTFFIILAIMVVCLLFSRFHPMPEFIIGIIASAFTFFNYSWISQLHAGLFGSTKATMGIGSYLLGIGVILATVAALVMAVANSIAKHSKPQAA